MVYIARTGLDEQEVIAKNGRIGGFWVPRSTQVHHRAKRNGDRLNDERWWMAVCRESHDDVEKNKGWAREEGYLLPIQADADGRWGAGNQALETPALMTSKIK